MCSLNGNKIQDITPLGVGLEKNNSLVELRLVVTDSIDCAWYDSWYLLNI